MTVLTTEEQYSENATKIYKKLYLAKDKDNNIIETIDQCHHRVCNFLAESNQEYDNFKRLLDEQKFRPNTPCMVNAGIKADPMLLACFVVSLEDTMESIIDMWSTCAHIYAGGGGAGIPITNLRRKGGGLSTGGYASGPLSYLDVIEVVGDRIKSGARQRRAANLIAARYDHPDIKDIITCKRDKNSYKSMNLSVVVDNSFMKKVVTGNYDYFDIIDPNDGICGMAEVKDVWDLITQSAWETGDPGLLFIDRVNEDNPLDVLIESTNPCFPGNAKVHTIYGPMSFKELAEKGEKTPVWSRNESGEIEIQMMRHIRCTQETKQELVRVHLDNGGSFDCTPDHKIYVFTKDGELEKAEAKNLGEGHLLRTVHLGYFHEIRVSYVIHLTNKEFVYNGIVDRNHNYFVHVGDNDAVLVANCGEVPTIPNGSCNLGHFNLTKYIGPNDPNFEEDIYWGTLFLNRVIERSSYPNKEFKENMHKYRPIGLGLMGFADFLYREKIQYGSDESIKCIDEFTRILTLKAYKSSSDLVAQGKIPDMTKNLKEHELEKFKDLLSKFKFPHGRTTSIGYVGLNYIPGNITVSMLAPTGSCAIAADCSFSTEPNFAVFWTKNLDGGGTLDFLNPEFEKALSKNPELKSIDKNYLIEQIKRNNGSIQNIDFLPNELKEIFVTAHDILNDRRIEMQAAAQKNITMAVSSTVNLPRSATKEDISEIYKTAWKKGLKGITVYRDGSLDNQPVDFGSGEESQQAHTEAECPDFSTEESGPAQSSGEAGIGNKGQSFAALESFEYTQPMERPDNLLGSTKKIRTGSGELYLTVNWHNGRPFEVFATIGKGGRSMAAKAEAIGRLVSLALRCRIHMDHIIKQLDGIGGDYPIFQNGGLIKSIPDAIASVLREIRDQGGGVQEMTQKTVQEKKPSYEKLMQDIQEAKNEIKNNAGYHDTGLEICPECGQPALRKDAGCRGGICIICGFSNCY